MALMVFLHIHRQRRSSDADYCKILPQYFSAKQWTPSLLQNCSKVFFLGHHYLHCTSQFVRVCVVIMAGLGDFSLGLSEEPVQGEWSIVVKQGDNEQSNMFTVEEYVLPKFEVKITPPAFVTINTTDVTVQLCAK